MAIRLIATIQRWEGLSIDDKPQSSDTKEGSTFHETDTGKKFIWLNSRWLEDISGPVNVNENARLQNALRQYSERQYILDARISDERESAGYNLNEIR